MWLKKAFRKLRWFLLNEAGEGEGGAETPPAGGGSEDTPPSGSEDTPPAGGGAGGSEDTPPSGSEDTPPAQPKYGKFGDNPNVDEVFADYQKIHNDHVALTGKTAKTEKNLASIRKALDKQGIMVLSDQDGNIVGFEAKPIDNPERKRRFTDERRKQFESFFEGETAGKDFYSLLDDYISDKFDDFKEESKAERERVNAYFTKRNEAVNWVKEHYPSVIKGDPNFNQALKDRADEIYDNEYCDEKGREISSQAQKLAVIQAAGEMGISAIAVAKAGKTGYQKGKTEKTILGPAGGGTGGPAKTGFTKKLSREEYLKLPQKERDEYNSWLLELDK